MNNLRALVKRVRETEWIEFVASSESSSEGVKELGEKVNSTNTSCVTDIRHTAVVSLQKKNQNIIICSLLPYNFFVY